MREIKFRAWYCGIMMYDVGVVDSKAIDSDGECVNFFHEQPDALMQYTGLKDKNGKEIYEGDIVKTTSLSNDHHQLGVTEVLEIRHFMGNCCLCFPGQDTGIPIYPFNVDHELEVIGNVYESPELLL